jgi:hypothetical protein
MFAIGEVVELTWQFSCRSGYEDKVEKATFVGMAKDGCYEFKNESGTPFGDTVHVYVVDGELWLDDMISLPMSVRTLSVEGKVN